MLRHDVRGRFSGERCHVARADKQYVSEVYFCALLFRRGEQILELNVVCFESIDRFLRRSVALPPAVIVEQHSAAYDTLFRHGLDSVSSCAATFSVATVASTEYISHSDAIIEALFGLVGKVAETIPL